MSLSTVPLLSFGNAKVHLYLIFSEHSEKGPSIKFYYMAFTLMYKPGRNIILLYYERHILLRTKHCQ